MTVLSLTGPYRIADYAYDMQVVLTNKCGAAPMRAPMSIASWVMDGTIEAVARALRCDPIERAPPQHADAAEFPWTMPAGPVLEDVTPRETLEAALASFDVAGVPRPPGGGPGARRVSRHGSVLRGGSEHLRLGILSRRRHTRDPATKRAG